jgi:hypothetical protein
MDKLPENMITVIHRGDISICEVDYRPIRDGLPTGKIFRLKYERDDKGGQLPEKTYDELFFFCLGQAMSNPERKFQYTRLDNEKLVPENLNNQPYKADEGFVKNFDIYGFRFTKEI